MGPLTLTPSQIKSQAQDLAVLAYSMNGEYDNAELKNDDIRRFITLYGYDNTLLALRNRINSAVKSITVNEVVSTVIWNSTTALNVPAASVTATQHFNDIFLYLVYKKVFNKNAVPGSFYSITGANPPTIATAPGGIDLFKTALVGLITPNGGSSWLSDLLARIIPLASFRVENISYGTTNPYSLRADDVTNSKPFLRQHDALAGGVIGFTGLDDIITFIRPGGAGAVSGLVTNDFTDALTTNLASKYITGLNPSTGNHAAVTVDQVNSIVDLVSPFVTNGTDLLTQLNNLGPAAAAAQRIPRTTIFQSNSTLVRDAIVGLNDYDAIFAYIPSNLATGQKAFLTRPAYEYPSSNELWSYSPQVQQIVLFADLLELTSSNITDLYSNLRSITPNFTNVRTALNVTNATANAANSCQIQGFKSDLVSPGVQASTFNATSVLEAYRHYSSQDSTTNIDYSKIKTADSFARFISNDYTKDNIVGPTAINAGAPIKTRGTNRNAVIAAIKNLKDAYDLADTTFPAAGQPQPVGFSGGFNAYRSMIGTAAGNTVYGILSNTAISNAGVAPVVGTPLTIATGAGSAADYNGTAAMALAGTINGIITAAGGIRANLNTGNTGNLLTSDRHILEKEVAENLLDKAEKLYDVINNNFYSGLNDSEEKLYKYFEVLNSTTIPDKKKPTKDIKVIYDGLKLLAALCN